MGFCTFCSLAEENDEQATGARCCHSLHPRARASPSRPPRAGAGAGGLSGAGALLRRMHLALARAGARAAASMADSTGALAWERAPRRAAPRHARAPRGGGGFYGAGLRSGGVLGVWTRACSLRCAPGAALWVCPRGAPRQQGRPSTRGWARACRANRAWGGRVGDLERMRAAGGGRGGVEGASREGHDRSRHREIFTSVAVEASAQRTRACASPV